MPSWFGSVEKTIDPTQDENKIAIQPNSPIHKNQPEILD